MDSIGWYIQMEFIDGITLDQFLETNPPAAIRRRIIEQLLDALSCLHERQIIHRDIKPSNILITRNGNTVKLIDFGVSDTDDYVTFKQPAGSMAYIAPEQLAGKTIDNRADIYAVGKIINLLFLHRYKHIVRICTRVKPAERYSSCAQVLQAIRRADRVRIWLPVSLILLLLSCAAVWETYSGYQHSELAHKENENQLFAHVDSLRAQNEEQRHQVDSLNRVLDSLAVKANTLSPREQVRQQAAAIHIARQAAIRKAVKRGELKTMNEVRNYDGGLQANFQKAKQSIKDPMLLEEFMQAYMNFFNMNDQLYDSLALVLPEY